MLSVKTKLVVDGNHNFTSRNCLINLIFIHMHALKYALRCITIKKLKHFMFGTKFHMQVNLE